MADKTLKDRNRLALGLIVLANVVGLYAISAQQFLAGADWVEAGRAVLKILPAGLGAVLVGVFNAQLDATTKARIVFMRWNHPLPGTRAFTKHGRRDSRVDMDALKTRLGKLPIKPEKQNALWYQLYREVADRPAILHANKEYLFTRDYHVLALGFLIVFGISSMWVIAEPITRTLYFGGLLLQVLMTGQAARNHGRRLVCNVLALSAPLPSLLPDAMRK